MSGIPLAWTVVGAVLAIIITVGVGVMSMTPPDFLVARVSFVIAALALGAMTTVWTVRSAEPAWWRISASILVGLVVFVLLPESLRWVTRRERAFEQPPQKPPEKTDTKSAPPFRPKLSRFYVVVGGNVHGQDASALRERPHFPFVFNGYKPIKMYAEDGIFYVDCLLLGSDEFPIVEVKRNEFTVRPPFDANHNDTALEVVIHNKVIFQMTRTGTDRIAINGIFPTNNGGKVMVANNQGTQFYGSINQVKDSGLTPIFRYPSWKYPGVLADHSN